MEGRGRARVRGCTPTIYLSIYDGTSWTRYRREFRDSMTRWMGLRASDDVIPMWKRPRTRCVFARCHALDIIGSTFYRLRISRVSIQYTDSFNGKNASVFLRSSLWILVCSCTRHKCAFRNGRQNALVSFNMMEKLDHWTRVNREWRKPQTAKSIVNNKRR